jgi:hypothetical protein
MPVPSNTIVSVVLSSGNRAVYEVQPQHLNPQSAIEHGRQLAHQQGTRWYKTEGEEITDPKTLALLERVPEITTKE